MAMPELRLQTLSVDLLGNFLGVALLGAALSLVWGLLRPLLISKKGVKSRTDADGSKNNPTLSSSFDVMGEVEPLKDLDWKNEKPLRIYKFADKYHLTMGIPVH